MKIEVLNAGNKTKEAKKSFALSLNIKRVTTDSQGIVLDDATVPTNERAAYPFHLFGEADRQAAYSLSETAIGQFTNWKLFATYTVGLGTPLFFASPVATINNYLKKGDVIFVYVSDLVTPNYFHFVIISAPQGGYAMLTAQTMTTQLNDIGYWGAFAMESLLYTWDDDSQPYRAIFLTRTKFDTTFATDAVSPSDYLYTILKPDVKTIKIPLELILNQYITFSSFIEFENKLLTLSLNIKR